MMLNETFEPHFNKRLNLYEIRLSETIAGETPEVVKARAEQKLMMYKSAYGFDPPYSRMLEKVLIDNYKLLTENAKLKQQIAESGEGV